MEWKETVYKREELYALVWDKPMRDVAQMVGVSDVALAKTCRGMGIPVPGRGYWARKASGQELERPPMPDRAAGQPGHYACRRLVGGEGAPPREPQRVERIVVADTLVDPHPLVAASIPLLRQSKEDRVNLHRRTACLDINVDTKGVLDRALRIMDALLKALEAQEFTVDVSQPKAASGDGQPEPEDSRTSARKGATRIQLCITEDSDQIVVKPKAKSIFATHSAPAEYRYERNGRLGLHILSYHWSQHRTFRRNWTDRENRPIENSLAQVIESCLQIVEEERRRTEEKEREEEAYRQAQQQRAEQERRREFEAARRKDLNDRMQYWEKAHAIRRFATVVEDDATRRGEAASEETPLGAWLLWARQHADQLERAALHQVGASDPAKG